MTVEFESIICVWDENIPTLLIQVVNTILFCMDENELRQSVKQLQEKTELDEYFVYGYGSHHFWINQRISKGNVQYMKNRLFIVEF